MPNLEAVLDQIEQLTAPTFAPNDIPRWDGGAFAPFSDYYTATEIDSWRASHLADPDPHPGYLTQAEGDALYEAINHAHPVSELDPGTANQLLRTNAAGNGVEWGSNITVPGTLEVNGTLRFLTGSNPYIFNTVANVLVLQAQTQGQSSQLRLAAQDGDATDSVFYEVWARGNQSDILNRERLRIGWEVVSSAFEITTEFSGTGVARPIHIYNENFAGIYLDTAGNISVGQAAAASARLHARGSAAAAPVAIFQGAASQSANLTEWRDSAGAVVVSVGPTGNVSAGGTLGVTGNVTIDGLVGIGTTPGPTNRKVELYYQVTNTSGNFRSLLSTMSLNNAAAASTTVTGYQAQAEIYTTAGGPVTGIVRGLYCTARNFGPVAASSMRAVDAWGSVDHASGSAAEWVAFYVNNPTATGTITNLHGLYVADLTSGVANYAIYTNLGQVRFGDRVNIINPTATNVPLVIQGAASQTASLTEWKNSAGTTLAAFLNSGYLSMLTQRILFNAGTEWHIYTPDGNGIYVTKSGTAGAEFKFLNTDPADYTRAILQIGNSTVIRSGGDSYLAGGKLGIGFTSTPTALFQVNNTAAATIAEIIQGAASQSANLTEWRDSAGAVVASVGPTGGALFTQDVTMNKKLNSAWLKSGYAAIGGMGPADNTLTGIYDRSETTLASARGALNITITGANTGITSPEKVVDGTADYARITGTDATTTQIVIHIDLLTNQSAYGSSLWQPFVQYRLAMNDNGTYYRNILVEISVDNVNWYTAPGWSTTDASASEVVPGLWLGESANPSIPGNAYRYVRFTLTGRWENAGYALRDNVWIAEVGLRHSSAPYARQYVRSDFGDMYGPLRFYPQGSTVAITTINRDGSATFGGQVMVGTATSGGQLTVKTGATSTHALYIDTVASPTGDFMRFLINGSLNFRFKTAEEGVSLLAMDAGGGTGRRIALARNSNATTPAAAAIYMEDKSGTGFYLWVDDPGNLRIHTSAPTNANDTAGTVVGTQVSRREFKNIYEGDLAPADALATLLRTPVRHFDYKSGAFNGSKFWGIIAEESPEFTMDDGRSFNPVNAFGYTTQAIKALEAENQALRQRIEQLEARAA